MQAVFLMIDVLKKDKPNWKSPKCDSAYKLKIQENRKLDIYKFVANGL